MDTQLSRSEVETIARSTTGQRVNPLWHRMREKRLTASSFGRALSASYHNTPTDYTKFRNSLFNPKDLSKIPAIRWGVLHEKHAIKEYQQSTGNQVTESGIWLFPDGYFGASPDGLIYKEDRLEGILEIKCPYKIRDLKSNTLGQLQRYLPYLVYPGGLRKESQYYHQVQGQLFATEAEWCDFFIWAPATSLRLRIYPDEQWKLNIFPRIHNFYLSKILRFEDHFILMCFNRISGVQVNPSQVPEPCSLTFLSSPSSMYTFKIQSLLIAAYALHIARIVNSERNHIMCVPGWKNSVNQFWEVCTSSICSTCVKTQFLHNVQSNLDLSNKSVQSLIFTFIDSHDACSDLLANQTMYELVKYRVLSLGFDLEIRKPACSCSTK